MAAPTRAELASAVRLGRRLYSGRLSVQYAARVERRPFARSQVNPWHQDPYPEYDRLREQGLLVPGRTRGVLLTAHHAVCDEALRSRALGMGAGDGGGAPDDLDTSLLGLDPPDHTRLRRVAAPAFTARRMKAYEASITRLVERLVDDLVKSGGGDLQQELSAPLPIAVISELLGVPDVDQEAFVRWGTALGTALDGLHGLRHARQLMVAKDRLDAMFTRLLEQRRRDPQDDLLSVLAAADDDQIRAHEILPLCTLLLVAGFETTVNLLGNGVCALMRSRDQWELLCADPSLAAGAVEEVLRYDPPVQVTGREVLQETEVAGLVLRPGQHVTTVIGAAGRDPAVHQDPHRFDITRPDAATHLAFSSGIHYCVGAPLARLEATVALRVLAERAPSLQAAGRAPVRPSHVIRARARVPVRV